MAKINRVIPGKAIPFDNVEDALRYGFGKVREAQLIKDQQAQIYGNLRGAATQRPGQGDVLEPFNFTAVVNRLFQFKKEKEQESARDAVKAHAAQAVKKGGPKLDAKGKAMPALAREKEDKENFRKDKKDVQVQVDEHGAVIREEPVTEKAGTLEKPAAAKVTSTVVGGTPAAEAVQTPIRNTEEKKLGNIVFTTVPSADIFRLNKKAASVPVQDALAPAKGPAQVFRAEQPAGDPAAGTSTDGRDADVSGIERKEHQRETAQAMTETVAKPFPQKVVEEHIRTPEEKQAERRVETELAKGAAKATAIIMAAETFRDVPGRGMGDRMEEGAFRKEPASMETKARIQELQRETPVAQEAVQTQKEPAERDVESVKTEPKRETLPMRETMQAQKAPAAKKTEAVTRGTQKESRIMQEPAHVPKQPAAGLPQVAMEKVDVGNIILTAANITQITGRELQFDKGDDRLQIRREGNDTFAFVNGRKAGMEEAKEFMKDLGNRIGPEKMQQVAAMVTIVAKMPDLTMGQVLGTEKASSAGAKAQTINKPDMSLGR